MRHFLTISALIILCFTCFGQKQTIDTLLKKIDNQKIVVMMQYVWYPKMFSPAGDALIKIGKPATKKLLPLLSDTAKGIIAHYILSNIWAEKLIKVGQKLSSGVSPVKSDTSVLRIVYTDFVFYQDNNGRNISNQNDLDKNKERWVPFFKTNVFNEK